MCSDSIMKKIGIFIMCILCGCSDKVKEVFGVDHYQPNEFLICNNPTLIYPQSFHLPTPGERKPIHINHSLLPMNTVGDTEFLKELKCDNADPCIRDLLQNDRKNVLEKLMDQMKKNFKTLYRRAP